jgi:hypothetical protein
MQNVDTQNKQKTIADFLEQAPVSAITGLYKGMESGVNAIYKGMEAGVGILSDYVENPARNISFDIATAGFGKGLKFLGAAGLLESRIMDDAYDYFRGVNRASTEKSLSKLVDDGMLTGGGKKIWGDAEKFPKSTYTTLFPRYAEGYAKNLSFGQRADNLNVLNEPGTVFRFEVPASYISEVNKEATEEISKRIGQKSFDPDYFDNIVQSIMRDKGGLVQGNLNQARYPFMSDMDELVKRFAGDPKGLVTSGLTRGTYRFREGIPIKFLSDLEFVPGVNTSQATIKRLNDAIRRKELIDILKNL